MATVCQAVHPDGSYLTLAICGLQAATWILGSVLLRIAEVGFEPRPAESILTTVVPGSSCV